MKQFVWIGLGLAVCMCPGWAADLPVRSITLYSTGVGYVERGGTVTGDTEVVLSFSPEQIPDVIKSLVFLDAGGGTVASAAYESRDPVARILSTFRVDLADNPGLSDLLNRMRGEPVSFATAGRTYKGRLVGVEPRVIRDDDTTVTAYRAAFLVDGALVSHDLDLIQSLTPDDEALARDLAEALATLAEGRSQDRKSLSLNLRGQGPRDVRLGYLTESPVWKTSYRMLIEDGRVWLQGWAHVDNPSDEDWTDVRLSLVSGRPVSFTQNLYDPVYALRPEIPYVPAVAAAPRRFEQALGRVAEDAQPRDRRQSKALAAAPAPMAMMEMAAADAGFGGGFDMDNFAGSAEAAAVGGEAGELFTYTVNEPVTVPRRQSAMLPVLSSELAATPLSVYRHASDAKHPMHAILFTNSSGAFLAQGPVTVLEAGLFAGDALLADTPQDAEGLIGYATDLAIEVSREQAPGSDELVSLTIVDGMLTLRRELIQTARYRVNSSRDASRLLMIEHPRRPEWTLTEPAGEVPVTRDHYRILRPIPAGGSEVIEVTERRDLGQTFALSSMSTDQVVYYRDLKGIRPAVRKALTELAGMQAGLAETRRAREDAERRIREITEEQQRIRENMKAVARGSDSFALWEAKLVDQETQLDNLKQRRDTLRAEEEKQQRAIANFLRGLDAGG